MTAAIGAILDFWFSERAQALCFERNDAFDTEIRDKFGAAVEEAQCGGYADWPQTPEGALALLILLDQMPRNIHRGSPKAFVGDPRALEIAGQAIAAGFDRRFAFPRRRFFYLPYEHSENPVVQNRSLELFAALAAEAGPEDRATAEEQLHYAKLHAQIIVRFGRYPHRNTVLGRVSSPEELAFLKEPNSSF